MNVMKTVKPESARSWIKPELVRLGQIADVAGPPAGALQSTTKS